MTTSPASTALAPSDESLRAIAFPFNVYARLIELEEGRVDYIHYGLFTGGQMSAAEAQQRASDLLWQHLPTRCKMLDVGMGLGATLRRLTDAGYEGTGITPDAAEIANARRRYGDALPMICCRYETFDAAPGSWQAILFQESTEYVDGIDLFDRADNLLSHGGEIIIMDKFLMQANQPGREQLHNLDHFLRLAERFGFTVVARLDLSALAAPTLNWILDGVSRHAAVLKAELGVDDVQLETINTSNRSYRQKFADGCYGYFLLRLRRKEKPRWCLGRIVGERSNEMRTLFAEVFGHEMSAAHWQWKYGGGRGSGVGVWRELESGDGQSSERKLVAHYGGTSREAMYFGQPACLFQVGDVMVSGSDRGSLTRKGAGFLAAAACVEHEVGYGAAHLLGVGFPSDRAYRVLNRLGIYTGCQARIQEVAWPAIRTRPPLRLTLRELNPASDTHLDACWEAMRASLGDFIVGVRDARYIRQRYLNHPDKSYRLFILKRRFGHGVIGLLVLRLIENEANGERRCELLDAVGALQWMPLLVHHARRVAAQWGCTCLFGWLADNLLPHFSLPADAVIQDLGVLVPGNSWTAGPVADTLVGRWWLTGGDTDFH